MFETITDSQHYSRKDSFIVNQIKLATVNEPLYLTALFLVFFINYKTERNIFISIFTFYAVTSWSYFSHLLAHNKLFSTFGKLHLLHHDPKYHDSYIVLLIEALIDFFVFGGFILIFFGAVFEKLFKFHIFNPYIILLWALFYLTYHLINYHISKPDAHKQHHIDDGVSNFGPEWMDIIFDTKTDKSVFENLNSGIFNLLVVSAVILYFKDSSYDLTHIFDDIVSRTL